MTKKLILLVDSDENSLKDLKSQEDYSVIPVSNAAHGLTALEKHKRWGGLAKNDIQCILLSSNLPETNPFNFLRTWQKTEYYSHRIPVILLIEESNIDVWKQIIHPDNGIITDVLTKPLHIPIVLDRLRSILVQNETQFLYRRTRERAIQFLLDHKE